MTARAMAVAVTVGVGKKVAIQVLIVLVMGVGLIMTIQLVRDVRVGVGRCAHQGKFGIVGNWFIQAATIRALSLTAGRDRTKHTEGVTSATIQPAFPARTARHAQRRVFATPPASPATLENTRTQGMSQAALPAQQANTARQMLLAVRIVPTTPSLLHPI